MTKLKLGPIVDDKPVKVTVELPADLHRDLAAYAEALGRENNHPPADPVRLIVPMLHPAAALHQPQNRPLLQADFQRLPAILAQVEHEQAPAPVATPPATKRPEDPPLQQLSLF